MRLIRFGPPGWEKPGLLLPDGTRVDASLPGWDWDERFFGADGLDRLAEWAREHAASAPRVPRTERLGPCVARPSKIICIGLNYADHARAETPRSRHCSKRSVFAEPDLAMAVAGRTAPAVLNEGEENANNG